MIKCSFIYVTTMNNNISYDLRTFLSLTTEKKQSILDYVQLPFHKLIFRHYWQMMSDILKTSYTEAIFKAAPPPFPPRVFIILGSVFQTILTSQRREQMLLSK